MVEVHASGLQTILDHDEDHKFDFKSADLLIPPDGPQRRKIARHLVGLANRGGGQLVFGVDDDSRMPEGKMIEREKAEGTLSEVARDKCSPSVGFESRGFYSSYSGDLSEGSVLVVEVESVNKIPSAVVDNSKGEVDKREYRLRTGDETRMVSDEELNQMFLGQLDPEFDEKIRTWYFYTEDNPTPGYHPDPGQCTRPMNASWSQTSIAQYLARMSDEDEERWVPDSARGLSNVVREIVPLAVVNQLSDVFRVSWEIEWRDHKPDGHGQEPNVPVECIEVDRSDIGSYATSNLDKSDFDWYDEFSEKNTFLAPAGTEARIESHSSKPKLVIEKEDAFKFEIGVVMEMYDTIPEEHPYAGIKIGRSKYRDSSVADWLSIVYDLRFCAEYNFPDGRDPNIESHRMFGEQIHDVLFHFWSTDVVTEGLSDREIYEMNEKMNYLVRGMDELLSSDEDHSDT
jgi:hypothetical protein